MSRRKEGRGVGRYRMCIYIREGGEKEVHDASVYFHHVV